MRISDSGFERLVRKNSVGEDAQASPELQAKRKTDQKAAEAEKVAQEFETMFMDLVMKGMRRTAMPEEASNALEIYQDMLDSEYSKTMTTGQDFGIRRMILDWMKTADPDLKQGLDKDIPRSLSDARQEAGKMKAALAGYKAMGAQGAGGKE